MQKECPLCGDLMTLRAREVVERLPGSAQEIRSVVREWVCRECEHFEEVDDA
jgi:C4-type Zn-finger protein